MKNHDRCRAADGRLPEDVARLDGDAVLRAERQHRGPHHAMLRIEQDDAELFEPTRAEPRQQILGRLARLAKLQPLARRTAEAAATQLERGQNLRRPRLADAGHAHQLVDRAPAQPAEAAERGQHGVADAERAAAPRSAADDHREQFVVAERRRPAMPQLLSRPVARQQVLHLTLFVRGSSGWSSSARYTGSCPRGVAACCPPPSSRRCWARRAAILPTRKCNRRRRRSRPRAPPAPTSSREKSSPPPKTPSNAPTKPSRSAIIGWRSTPRSTRASARRTPPSRPPSPRPTRHCTNRAPSSRPPKPRTPPPRCSPRRAGRLLMARLPCKKRAQR